MAWVPTTTEVIVTAGENPKRLDAFLANRDPDLSRSVIQRLMEEGRIRLNDRPVKPSQKIRPGDRITIEVPRAEPLAIQPEAIPISVLYEDDALLVLNKPPGLVVHPAPGHWEGTLVNALLHHFARCGGSLSSIGGKERPGLVHRLDKETSGVMVIAKTDRAHARLAAQFTQHTITREYEALVWGAIARRCGVIELAIGRDTKERKKFSPRSNRPKAAVTKYQVIRRFGTWASYVVLHPQTGRTHQLRVHLKSIGHPILGDETYGGRKVMRLEDLTIPRVMLHARVLGFTHPVTDRAVQFSAPAPADMVSVHKVITELTTGLTRA
ncbi:pseudouridine synthase [Nitrospira sp.]|nr:pseudouridine synthase [Nitrospira sp.]